jgi:hypothetical protein
VGVPCGVRGGGVGDATWAGSAGVSAAPGDSELDGVACAVVGGVAARAGSAGGLLAACESASRALTAATGAVVDPGSADCVVSVVGPDFADSPEWTALADADAEPPTARSAAFTGDVIGRLAKGGHAPGGPSAAGFADPGVAP